MGVSDWVEIEEPLQVRPIRKFVIATGLVLAAASVTARQAAEPHPTKRTHVRANTGERRPQRISGAVPFLFAAGIDANQCVGEPSTCFDDGDNRDRKQRERGQPLGGGNVVRVAFNNQIPPRDDILSAAAR